jgi:hypothetical protein
MLYLEYQSVCPLVRIGSLRPSPASECVIPGTKGEGGNTRLRVRGWGGGANSDDWRDSLAHCLLCDEYSYPSVRPSIFEPEIVA